MSKLCLLLVASFLLSFTAANAQYAHPLTNLPPSGKISTGYYFPEHPNKHFPVGEAAKINVNIRNEDNKPYNISAILGSLHPVQDASVYFYNFTQQVYFVEVLPEEEQTIEYNFFIHKELPPRDYLIALTVFYEDPSGGFKSTTFFNGTIEAVEIKKLIDTELISLYILLIAFFGGIGYLVYQYVQPYVKTAPAAKKVKKVEPVAPRDDSDWVSGTNYDRFVKKKSAASKNKSS